MNDSRRPIATPPRYARAIIEAARRAAPRLPGQAGARYEFLVRARAPGRRSTLSSSAA